MKKILLIFVAMIVLSTSAVAETSVQQTILKTKQDIDNAIKTLTTLRDKQLQEKIALSRDIVALENKVIPLRKKADTLKTIAWQKETGFQQLNEDLDYLRQELAFCTSVLNEFRREMSARMQAPERQVAVKKLAELESLFRDKAANRILLDAGQLLTFVEKHNMENRGGRIITGQAVDQQGTLQNGQFVCLGPLQLFVSQDKQMAGQVNAGSISLYPSLQKSISGSSVQSMIQGHEVKIPMDVTAGEAVKIEQQKKTWIETVQSGGVVMIPILLLGVLCTVTALWKMLSLKKLKLDDDVPLDEIISLVNKKQISAARTKALALGLPLGPVLAEGIEHAKVSREQLEEIMHEQILAQIPFLEKYLSLLAVAAAVAPLLGLLGTVTGMVHTFDLVAVFGTGKANILSGGISEALITTEYGLIVAIPTLLVHAFLSRRVKRVIHILERNTLAFINGLRKHK